MSRANNAVASFFGTISAPDGSIEHAAFFQNNSDFALDIAAVAIVSFGFASLSALLHRYIFWPVARRVFPAQKGERPFHGALKRTASTGSLRALRNNNSLNDLIDAKAEAIRAQHDLAYVIVPCVETDLPRATDEQRKFVVTCWRFVSYGNSYAQMAMLAGNIVSLVAFGVYSLWNQDWLWEPSRYHLTWPNNKIPTAILRYYYLGTGYYVCSSITIFFEPRMKDRNAMLVHHAATLLLLLTSYYGNLVRFGAAIMLLHDVSDPFMELAKLMLYMKKERAANALFAIFAAVFVITRDYIYPRYLIATVWFSAEFNGALLIYRADPVRYGYVLFWPTFIFLNTLFVLHLFWTYLILKMVLTMLTTKIQGDIREE